MKIKTIKKFGEIKEPHKKIQTELYTHIILYLCKNIITCSFKDKK